MLQLRPGTFIERLRLFVGRALAVIGGAAVPIGFFPLLPEEVVDFLVEQKEPILTTIAIVATLSGVLRLFQPSHISFTAAGARLKIEVKCGDLFAEPNIIAVPVNDFFDTELGDFVSPKSVHGQFLEQFYDGKPGIARRAIDAELKATGAVATVDPSAGQRSHRYPVGQTCVVEAKGRRAVLVALASADATTRQTAASLAQYVNALTDLWVVVRACCHNETVSVPLMGAGPSRTNLPLQQLAELILMTAVREHHIQAIASTVVLVLRKEDLAKVDLFQLKRNYG